MKVLWFVNAPFTGDQIGHHITGGRGGWLSNLAGLVREDVDLHVACVYPRTDSPFAAGRVTTYFIHPSFWKLRLLATSLTNVQFFREFSVLHLQEIIDSVNPDLIHIHGTEKGYIQLLDNQEKIAVPVMVSMQGIMSSYHRFFCGGYDEHFLRRFWYDLGGKKNSLLPKRFLPARNKAIKQGVREQKYLKLARYIDGRTDYDRMVTRVLAPTSKYFHIDRVLRKSFGHVQWKGGQQANLVLHTTLSDSLAKGFDLVAETAVYLDNLLTGFRWRIAGLHSNSNTVKAARRKLGKRFPENCFDFLGSLSPQELSESLSTASMFVLPSYMENSPNSLAEAQVIGIPCVATNVGGVPSYLKDKEDGLLVPPGDALALAGAIWKLFSAPMEAAFFSENAKKKALLRHCPERIKQQLLQTYRLVKQDFDANRRK